jgi:hypothetical protein
MSTVIKERAGGILETTGDRRYHRKVDYPPLMRGGDIDDIERTLHDLGRCMTCSIGYKLCSAIAELSDCRNDKTHTYKEVDPIYGDFIRATEKEVNNEDPNSESN